VTTLRAIDFDPFGGRLDLIQPADPQAPRTKDAQ